VLEGVPGVAHTQGALGGGGGGQLLQDNNELGVIQLRVSLAQSYPAGPEASMMDRMSCKALRG